jgi:lantibiotic modifying enzyme
MDMRHDTGHSGLNRRDFLRITAAGSALVLVPGSREALAAGIVREVTPLETAVAADRWLRTSRMETEYGVTWPMVPGNPESADTSLYSGSPGVVLFLSELADASGREEALADAVGGADHLLGLARAGEIVDPGLYTGLAGIAYTLERVHQVSGLDRFRDGASMCIDKIIDSAQPDRGGLGWSYGDMDSGSSDIVSGAAGVGLGLLWAHETLGHTRAKQVATDVGVRLVDVGSEAEGGLMWGPTPVFQREYPNFSHGTGGIAYFLARLADATGDRTILGAAESGAAYLEAAGQCQDDGCAILHHRPGGEDLYYLSWCHGPAGTARLFHQLGVTTGDRRWSDWVLRGAKATQNFGVPEVRSAGYWNNVSQCCGDAGVGEFFLALEALTGDAAHGRFAQRVGDWLLGESSEEDHGRKWIQAENRVSPDEVVAQTGWMQGAAGVGAFFLHLDGREKGRRQFVSFPDSPWTV